MSKLYEFITWLIGTLIKKPKISGMENIEAGVPAIFVANHLGLFGPVMLLIFTNFHYILWVDHEAFDRRLCKEYIVNFVEPTLGLKYPVSDLVAAIMSPIWVALMKYLKAIPVYAESKQISVTIEQSVSQLEKGNNLLIFPEIPNQVYSDMICKFKTGFVNIARIYFRRHNISLNFYPVCVNRLTNQITFGSKIAFDPGNPFNLEKKRVINGLMDSIASMYRADQAGTGKDPLTRRQRLST